MVFERGRGGGGGKRSAMSFHRRWAVLAPHATRHVLVCDNCITKRPLPRPSDGRTEKASTRGGTGRVAGKPARSHRKLDTLTHEWWACGLVEVGVFASSFWPVARPLSLPLHVPFHAPPVVAAPAPAADFPPPPPRQAAVKVHWACLVRARRAPRG